jgi:hypothetical protein
MAHAVQKNGGFNHARFGMPLVRKKSLEKQNEEFAANNDTALEKNKARIKAKDRRKKARAESGRKDPREKTN